MTEIVGLNDPTRDEVLAAIGSPRAKGPRRGGNKKKLPRAAGVPRWEPGFELRVDIPGNPQAWQRPVEGANGGRFTPRETLDAEKLIGQCAARALGARKPLNGPVELLIWLWRKNRHAVDYDNLLKTIGDGLTGIAWCDDDQPKDGAWRIRVDANRPRTTLIIRPGPPDAWDDWG